MTDRDKLIKAALPIQFWQECTAAQANLREIYDHRERSMRPWSAEQRAAKLRIMQRELANAQRSLAVAAVLLNEYTRDMAA